MATNETAPAVDLTAADLVSEQEAATALAITGRGGRGKPEFAATWQPTPDGLRLRIDDGNDDAFWLELAIPEATLRQWLREVELAGALDPA